MLWTRVRLLVPAFSAALLLLCPALRAQAVRGEAPIRAVQLSDGTVRFAVPITVGGQPVLAGLDTGSAGLQLLPAAQHNLQPDEGEFHASYGSGTLLTGHAARAQIGIGTVAGEVVANQITAIGCVPQKPDCGGSRVPLADFGIMGDGLPREGFAALLGVRTQRAPQAGHPSNPLVQLGVQRWIVVLPQPGTGVEGRLILNPTPAELAGFVAVPTGSARGEVQACLDRPAPAQTHLCTSALLDTGAPGIVVLNAAVPAQARQGAPARITFGMPQQPRFALRVDLNERAQMSRYTVKDRGEEQESALHLGPLPYLSFAVLYDAATGDMALRPRPQYPGGPMLLPLP